MKCTKCGGEIAITDERCPFCGSVNKGTAGHRADLKAYSKRNEKAKHELSKTLDSNVPLIISAVVMVVLIIGVAVAFYVEDNAYSFRSDAMRKEAKKNYETYSAEIEEYLKAGDYTGFAAFKGYHNIAEWEAPYDDLRLLWEITVEYNNLVSAVESSVMYGPEARRYLPEEDVYSCRRAIRSFYYEYENKLSKIEEDPYRDYIFDMKQKADIILKVYLGMDDATREAYMAASEIEQEAYLEEVLINE